MTRQLPKVETRLGRPLSPYALTKLVCEEYCSLFLPDLRPGNLPVFATSMCSGPGRTPNRSMPQSFPALQHPVVAGQSPIVYGDGEQTRDFTFISNVIDANWLAATSPSAAGEVFNIGVALGRV